jgi:outer membrane protein OmpA-like peptidoglycan-associated protein
MKILSIGLLAFLSWSVFSAYIYVCKIKGYCKEVNINQLDTGVPFKMTTDGDEPKSPGDKVAIMPDNMIVYFAFDKSDFLSDSQANDYFEKSNEYFAQNPLARLNITGYADETGTDEYNQALGYRRAQSMKLYFENKGISETKITIGSRGENDPSDDNKTISGRANNRRTLIAITK